MEELGFLWLEEPFREQELRQYQELCRELTIPVMATEMLMHDVNVCAQWLIAGATDLVRANARGGTTALLKMAHFAELYGTNVEMNGPRRPGRPRHVQLQCAIANTELYEHFARFAPLAGSAGSPTRPRSSTATYAVDAARLGTPRSTGTTWRSGRSRPTSAAPCQPGRATVSS